MKKLLSLSLLIIIVMLTLFAKSANAQTNLRAKSIVVVKPAYKPGSNGYWKWSKRVHSYVWVEGRTARRIHAHKGYRVRYW